MHGQYEKVILHCIAPTSALVKHNVKLDLSPIVDGFKDLFERTLELGRQ
jgi:hypothetical protein